MRDKMLLKLTEEKNFYNLKNGMGASYVGIYAN